MKIKRVVSMIMAIVMTFSLIVIPANAANVLSYNIVVSETSVTNDADHTVTVSINTATEISANVVGYVVELPTELEYISLVAGEGSDCDITVQKTSTGYKTIWEEDDNKTFQNIGVLTLKVPKDTPKGPYIIKINQIEILDVDFELETSDSVTATITVEEPEAPPAETNPTDPPAEPADYEIYYELDSDIDEIGAGGTAGSDNYMEYDVSTDAGKIVTATVFLKNNTDADITLQAYDIYLDYHEGLKYKCHAMTGAAALIEGSNTDQADTAGAAVTHIEAVSDSYVKDVAVGGRTVAAKGELELGTITFTIDADNENVKYGTDLNITLTDAEDTENSAKDEEVTNFSVGSDTTGDKTSYYPMDISITLGAEVNNTYTIQFASIIDGATLPGNVTKQHNVPVTLESASLDGYEFLGWTTDETPELGDTPEYEAGDSYTANESDTLYAVWDVATAEYTVKHMQQNVAGTGYVEVEEDCQTLSGQTGATTKAVAKPYEGFTAQAITQGTIAADGSTVVEIKYDRISYTITFNTDGGNAIEAITAKYGAAITAPANPIKTGYLFDSWDKEIPTTMPVNGLTIKANWTPIAYTVVYDANTGTGTTASSAHTYDVAKALTANGFTKTGYTFTGWNTQANGEGTSYESTEVVMNLATAQNAEVKLYAQWTANTYTVKFNPGTYGEGTMADQILTYDKSESLNANMFTSTDDSYAFAGWATSENGDVVYKNNESVTNLAASGEFNLYAVWKQNTINYEANPTGVQMILTDLPVTYTIGEAFDITIKPTATGYTFNGWSCEAYGINTVGKPEESITIPATATGNVELTAHWTVDEYTITFTETGDSTIEDITQDYGTAVSKPADPTKTGYSFVGWDVDGDGDTDADDVFPATMPATDRADKTITITAIWQIKQYTITFDAAGGTPTPEAITQDYNTTVDSTGVQVPSKTGYTFNGWSPAIPSVMPASDTTVVAQWTENNYTIKFETGDFGTIEDIDASYTEEVALPDGTDLSNPGYEVKGWTTEKDPAINADVEYQPGEKKSGLTDKDDATVILYPVWTEGKYDLTFNIGDYPADKNTVLGAIEVTYNDEYPALHTIEAAPGYEFVGWFNGNTQIKAGDTVTITADTELTAKYEAIQYTITLNANGGTVDPATITYYINDTVTLPTPTNGLYVFGGWKLETKTGNWEASTYNPGDYTEKYGVKDQAMELVAQWDFTLDYVVEDYKYALNTGYKMLRVANNLDDGEEYKFNSESMYYTEDTNYLVEDSDATSVFYTLIEDKYVGDDGKLNADGIAKLTTGGVTEARVTIDYTNYDINNDGVVNIADANIIYQMVQSGGAYYNGLSIEQRLRADLDTRATGNTNDHRGSIADVNVIVNDINGVVG